jgi:pimeloyl-ACP methyl ester carboxylesterase
VAVDLRGHGESSGRYHSYGVEESRDLLALVDELERRALLTRPLAVVGTSYGAATALQYAALDARVDKVVALARSRHSVLARGRARVRGVDRGPLAHLVPGAVLDSLVDEAAREAGFDADDACPRCAARRIRVPTMLIPSRDDERIPFGHSVAIREVLPASAELMLVSGVGHVRVGSARGVDQAIARWLDH